MPPFYRNLFLLAKPSVHHHLLSRWFNQSELTHPRKIGLNKFERSFRVLSHRRLSLYFLALARMAFSASLLTAGVKLTKTFPHRFLDNLGRNVNPKKSKLIFSYSP